MMQVFLDDNRPPPSEEGWVLCRWPEEVIEHLKTGKVSLVSLDWDLGENFSHQKPRTGYTVLDWIEYQVVNRGFKPPRIRVHTGCRENKLRMKVQARNIRAAWLELQKLGDDND